MLPLALVNLVVDRRRRLGARRERCDTNPTARKRYWNEPTMTWWERAYLLEILRGLAHHRRRVPAEHVALDDVPQGRAHDLLPGGDARRLRAEQPRQARADAAPGRQAAVHRLQHVRDGVPGEGASRSRRASIPTTRRIRSTPVRFEIDYSRCIFCGLCVEACPEDAIRMVKEVPDLPALRSHGTCGWRWTELLSWNPQRDVAQALSAQRRAARRGAAMIETLLLIAVFARHRRSSSRCSMLVLRQPMRVGAGAHRDACVAWPASTRCSACTSIAVFQVLIYVGAVMVFMVYAIMLLDVRDASYAHASRAARCPR